MKPLQSFCKRKSLLRFAKQHWAAITLIAIGVLFMAHALINHHFFHTYAYDLGIYSHALWQYAHGIGADCNLFVDSDVPVSLLHDHFDLYLIIFSPLVLIFGQYTLQIIQVLALMMGGWGIYRYIQEISSDTRPSPTRNLIPWMGMLCYFSFFGVWHAVSYDYHSNVVAANFLPWLFLFLKRERFGWAFLSLLAICISKESAPLWLTCVAIGLLIEYWGDRRKMRWIAVYGLFCLVYFVVITMAIMPLLGEGGSPGFWRYSHMGDSMSQVALYMMQHPWQSICMFFTNFQHDICYQGLKLEFWLCCAGSGLLMLFFKPHYLIMMLPPLLLKMMSRDAGFWGITFQYNIEFAPILVLGAFSVIVRFGQQKNGRAGIILAAATLLLTLSTTTYTCRQPLTHISRSDVRILDKRHYKQSRFNIHCAYEMIEMIPDTAKVCADMGLVSHLAMREHITLFPIKAEQADYIIMSTDTPSRDEAHQEIFSKITADTLRYKTIAADGRVILIQRGSQP